MTTPLSWNAAIRRAFFTLLLCVLATSIGIFAAQYAERKSLQPATANAAKVLANHFEARWLDEDMLFMQRLIATTYALPNIDYAAVLDAAKTPLAEQGDTTNKSQHSLLVEPIHVSNSIAGYVVLGYKLPSKQPIWWLLLWAILPAGVMLLLYKPQPAVVSNEPTTPKPVATALVTLAAPLDAAAQTWIEDLNATAIEYYDATTSEGIGYWWFDFTGENAVGRCLAFSRLWYGCYYAMCKKRSIDLAAGVYIDHADNAAASDQHGDLLKVSTAARTLGGVTLATNFAQDPTVTDLAFIAERSSGFYLKALCADEEALVKGQLKAWLKRQAN